MHMLRLNQVLLLMIIPFGRQTSQKRRMTHKYHFFILFNLSTLEIMSEEFSELEASFKHFEGVFHPVREFIVCKLE